MVRHGSSKIIRYELVAEALLSIEGYSNSIRFHKVNTVPSISNQMDIRDRVLERLRDREEV